MHAWQQIVGSKSLAIGQQQLYLTKLRPNDACSKLVSFDHVFA
jgi:hypothetical protein